MCDAAVWGGWARIWRRGLIFFFLWIGVVVGRIAEDRRWIWGGAGSGLCWDFDGDDAFSLLIYDRFDFAQDWFPTDFRRIGILILMICAVRHGLIQHIC